MNRDELKGQWKQMKGSVKSKWGRLTDDEMMEIDGDWERLVGKVQEKYGQSREDVERELDELRLDNPRR
jgi:uncharacterized protein YjbJ (UPF0337 family)